MGLRYRKSINLGGGFRVNLSKSGVSYSWGVRGYRVTKTSRGSVRQTVSIPGTGISYVTESSGKPKNASASSKKSAKNDPYANISEYRQITSAEAKNFQPPEYKELFRRLKFRKIGIIALSFLTLALVNVHPVLAFASLVGLIAFIVKFRYGIEYEFDDVKQKEWDTISSWWRKVAMSQGLKQVDQTATLKNSKIAGGASQGVGYVDIKYSSTIPKIKTNVLPVVFELKDKKYIAILPDRLLIKDKKGFGVISYDDVKFEIDGIGLLDNKEPPKDADIVDYKWMYVNSDGTPDKRYKNNRQVPVVKYARIKMQSKTGLDVHILCSNVPAAEKLLELISEYYS